MKDKTKKILSVAAIVGFLLYALYLTLTSDKPDLGDMRSFAVVLFSSCMLLSQVFTNKIPQPVPDELLENEVYLEAKDRERSGEKIAIAGVVMMVAPLALLFILGELHEFLASVGIMCFFLGVLAILIGLLVVFIAGRDLAQFPNEMVQDSKPDSKTSRFFSNLGLLAAGAVLILWVLEGKV